MVATMFLAALFPLIAPASGLANHGRPHRARSRTAMRRVAAPGALSAVDAAAGEERAAADARRFRRRLDDAGLSRCHGVLHASGCRRWSDLGRLNPARRRALALDATDDALVGAVAAPREDDVAGDDVPSRGDAAWYRNEDENFAFEAICAENGIFKGESDGVRPSQSRSLMLM